MKKEPVKRKPAAIMAEPKPAPKPAPKPVVAPKPMDVDNEIVVASDSDKEDDVEVVGLTDRLKKRLSTSSISPKSLSGDSLDSQLVHASVSPVKPAAAGPKLSAATHKKKAVAAKPATKIAVAKSTVRLQRASAQLLPPLLVRNGAAWPLPRPSLTIST